MEMACPGAPGSAAGQKELAKAKEKTQAMGKKQNPANKLEAVEKSPVFCGKWDILNDVITKGTAKEGSEGGLAAISIIAQAECKGPGWGQRGQVGGPTGGHGPCARVARRRGGRSGQWLSEIFTRHSLGGRPRMSRSRSRNGAGEQSTEGRSGAGRLLPVTTGAGEESWEASQVLGLLAGSSGRPLALCCDLGQPEHLWRGPRQERPGLLESPSGACRPFTTFHAEVAPP